MPGLKDIAKKLRKNVALADEQYPVRGLTADELANLLLEYPEFEKLLGGGFDRLDPKAMVEQAPAGLAKFVATGLCEPSKAPSDAEIQLVRGLPAGAMLDLLAPIAELSLPKAIVSPFVALIRGDSAATSGRAPDTRSPDSP